MNLDKKLEDWKKLTKLKNQISETFNPQTKTDLIRSFGHQAKLYQDKYSELYSPVSYPQPPIDIKKNSGCDLKDESGGPQK